MIMLDVTREACSLYFWEIRNINDTPSACGVKHSMSDSEEYSPIQRIKKAQENTVVVLGVAIGFVLLLYFFTFAAMVDGRGSMMAWFQAVTTALMAAMLVFIKRIAFFLTRLRLRRRVEYRELFASLRSSDLDAVKLD